MLRGALRFLMLMALVVWIGGIIFFAFVVAPILFSVLPSRELAGRVVAQSIAALHWMGVVCAVVFVAAALVRAHGRLAGRAGAECALVVLMLVLTLVSQLGITRRMETLRREMGTIDNIAANDPRRLEFDRLHPWSTGLEGAVLLAGIATVFLVARES